MSADKKTEQTNQELLAENETLRRSLQRQKGLILAKDAIMMSLAGTMITINAEATSVMKDSKIILSAPALAEASQGALNQAYGTHVANTLHLYMQNTKPTHEDHKGALWRISLLDIADPWMKNFCEWKDGETLRLREPLVPIIILELAKRKGVDFMTTDRQNIIATVSFEVYDKTYRIKD